MNAHFQNSSSNISAKLNQELQNLDPTRRAQFEDSIAAARNGIAALNHSNSSKLPMEDATIRTHLIKAAMTLTDKGKVAQLDETLQFMERNVLRQPLSREANTPQKNDNNIDSILNDVGRVGAALINTQLQIWAKASQQGNDQNLRPQFSKFTTGSTPAARARIEDILARTYNDPAKTERAMQILEAAVQNRVTPMSGASPQNSRTP